MFQPIENNLSIYKRIVLQIQEMIRSGELKKGDRLPPERQLAEMLQVGRPAVKQAISALEAMGIVTCLQGNGNYITSDLGNVFSPIVMQFYLDNGNLDDILEFRYILEVQTASLAALKITDEQVKEFAELLREMKEASEKENAIETRKKYNGLFHSFIIDLCGNHFISSVYQNIMELIADQIGFTDGVNFYESHEIIYEAIVTHNPIAAAKNMSEHFKNKFPDYQYYRVI